VINYIMLDTTITGILHIHVAFDWGDEVDLEQARSLVPAERHVLPRRRRTPSSMAFRPPPLQFTFEPAKATLPELGEVKLVGEATVFDFAAVTADLRVPFQLTGSALLRLAASLAEPEPLVQTARTTLQPLYRKLLPAIEDPAWREDLSEEYFVFQFEPGPPLPEPRALLEEHGAWLANLLRLESGPLSADEIRDALRLHVSYSPQDLLVPDWGAAVLIDRDCEETLQAIEFANLQLLEYRHIDDRLDEDLAGAYAILHPLTRSRMPFWRSHARALRKMGDFKLEASVLFERTGNVLKLVGDQYLARVFNLLAQRFHLEDWRQSIQRTLEVVEGAYQVVSDEAAQLRTELLEIVVIVLIFVELVLALTRH
jgi:hypothetical protein